MRIRLLATIASALAVIACGGETEPDDSGHGLPVAGSGGSVEGPGGAGGGDGGTSGEGGSGGAGGEGGEGGTGGIVPVGNPFDPNWGPCLSGPPRRPATGTALRHPVPPYRLPPIQTELELYELTINPVDYAQLQKKPREDTMYPAVFEARGERHEVLVRYRGNSSRGWPKKSWRIELPEGTRFDGRRKLNLISSWRDSTLMVEKLSYDFLEALGFPGPRARYVRLEVNGVYEGVYLDIERVDKNFLVNHELADKDATIYRCGMKDCEFKLWSNPNFQRPFTKMTNETDPTHVALEQFLCAVNAAPEPELIDILEERVELELHLRAMTMDALMSNDTIEDSRSYLIFDAFTGRMLYVPWDLNNSTTRLEPGNKPGKEPDFDHPLFIFSVFDGWSELEYLKRRSQDGPSRGWHPMSSNLNNRIAMHPVLRTRLIEHIERAMAELFNPVVLDPWIDRTYALLLPWAIPDPYIDNALFDDGPRFMKEYVRQRRAVLQQELNRLKNLPTDLLLEAVNPASGKVVLRNRSGAPVDTSRAVLTTNVRQRPLQPNLPARLLAPGETLEVRLASLGLTLQIPGELALWLTDNPASFRDLLFIGQPPEGKHYARDETGLWQYR